jgi:hypothetical protein
MNLLIQQTTNNVLEPMPWPIEVDHRGEVLSGRPDANALLGFQKSPTIQHIDIPFLQLKDPADAVGLYPVFSGGGTIFNLTQPIASVVEVVR